MKMIKTTLASTKALQNEVLGKLLPISLIAIPLASFTISTPIVAEAYVQKHFPAPSLSTIAPGLIPNEKNRPNPGPRNTNPIESQIMAMSTKKALQRELSSVRANYRKWKGDPIAMKTQTRLAQIIHLRANQVGVLLQ